MDMRRAWPDGFGSWLLWAPGKGVLSDQTQRTERGTTMNGLPYVIHPTNRPNYCEVVIGDLTMYFSYRTCIAFAVPGQGLVARVNEWGPTISKHLAEVGVDKDDRIPGAEFEARLRAITDRMRVMV